MIMKSSFVKAVEKTFECQQIKLIYEYNGEYFHEIVGVEMGFPFVPILVDIFIVINEEVW